MRVIRSYPLPIADTQTITLPEDSNFLSVQTTLETPDVPVLFVMHDEPEAETILHQYTIRMMGTDSQIDDDTKLSHIATIQIRGRTFALHVFEEWGE